MLAIVMETLCFVWASLQKYQIWRKKKGRQILSTWPDTSAKFGVRQISYRYKEDDVRPSVCPYQKFFCDRSQMQKGARNELPPQIIVFSLRSQEKETHYVQERNTRKSSTIPSVNRNTFFHTQLAKGPWTRSSLSLSFSQQKNNTEENWPATRAAQPPSACQDLKS